MSSSRRPDSPAVGALSWAIRFTIDAWDVNCPQRITPRYTEEDLRSMLQQLRDRIAELEEENRRLREGVGIS